MNSSNGSAFGKLIPMILTMSSYSNDYSSYNFSYSNERTTKCEVLCSDSNERLSGKIKKWFRDVLTYCNSEKLTKEVKREVASGVFPAHVKVTITDISVKTRGPDEGMYDTNEVLRKYVPRGLTLIKIEDETGATETVTDTIIFANKKFCGNTQEDDDLDGRVRQNGDTETNETKDKYFLSSSASAYNVVATEKINGEAAHFSGRFIDGQFYLIAGSKNVHLIFREKEHIDLYTEERYAIARDVAYAVLQNWRSMTEEKRTCLAQFLHLTRTTVVCEIMMPSHQHVVSFSGLTKNTLVVIALTPPPEQHPASLTALPTRTTLQFFSILGYEIPNHESLSVSDVPDHITQTRRERDTEGIVYYYEDADGNTIGLLKVKSCWYIHLRALRQQAFYRHTARKSTPKTIEQSKQRSRGRMEELQEWLLTTDEELSAWKRLSDQWLEWLEGEVENGTVPAKEIKENFPFVWQPFTETIKHDSTYDTIKLMENLKLK